MRLQLIALAALVGGCATTTPVDCTDLRNEIYRIEQENQLPTFGEYPVYDYGFDQSDYHRKRSYESRYRRMGCHLD